MLGARIFTSSRAFSAFFNRARASRASSAVRRALSSSPSSQHSPGTRGVYAENGRELDMKGFTVLRDLFTAAEVDKMKDEFENGALVKSRSMMEQTKKMERVWMENDEETRSVYWKSEDERGGKSLILQAGEGRYDLYRGFEHDTVFEHPAIAELVKSIMVDDYTNYSGYLLSEPMSSNQYFHRDTNTLSNRGTNGSVLIGVDDFYFTVLVPLDDVTEENGPTEFMVGSHRSTSPFDGCLIERVKPMKGDALIFNGKINHRGTGNRSKADKAVSYTVIHKLWYHEFRKGVDI